MSFLPLSLPPGIYRNGTQYQSKGRWYDANLVRFCQGTIQPHGGWRVKSTATLAGKGRAIISWHDNSGSTWSAIGTESHLYAMTRGGAVSDITPAGFISGRADAVAEGAYGDGVYGGDAFGTPRADANQVQDASLWSLDNWGEDLVGVMSEDTVIYQWTLSPSPAATAVAVANAPSALAILTTNEDILMALGTPTPGVANNPRHVSWSDQQNNTDWTPSAANQAGDYELPTNGRLMMGLRVKAGTLLFTDLDLWLASYTANELVYGFDKLGQGCGAISRACAMALDAQAVWMGNNGFWLYDGYVRPLPCDVWDYVFADLNLLQKSKITCELNSAFGEVTWRYPSGSSTEIDRFVTWNFRENHWTIGALARLSGVDGGVNSQYPMRVGADGLVYEHEVGFAYDGAVPYLESGPFELGNGDTVQYATRLLPDDLDAGDVSATFFVKFAPDGAETRFGPYTLSKRTDVRFGGRQLRVRYDGVSPSDWRIGAPRLDATAGGLR